MYKRVFALAVSISAFIPAVHASEKPATACKATFQVVVQDRLNNMTKGVPPSHLKDIDKRLSKLGDVCYTSDEKSDLVFFIHTTPATYHGHHVYTNTSSTSAAAASGNSAAAASASSTSTTAVPYTVDYSVYILDIEAEQPDGSFKVFHTLDQKGLYNMIYGIGYGKGKHPIPNVIEAGARWLHTDYLSSGVSTKW